MNFSRILLYALTVSCLTACQQIETLASSYATKGPADQRPNILLIVADDLGFSDIGVYGGEIHTPNLDALAASGIQFTNFSAAPTCSPTRAMLMSGVDSHLAGLGAMHELMPPYAQGKPGYEGYLNFNVATLPELLSDAGYHTYMAGKWHLGLTPTTNPKARGFEQSFALLDGASFHFNDWTYADPEIRGKERAAYSENGIAIKLPDDFYSTHFYTKKIIDYIGSNAGDDKPFFAYLALTSPHWPLQAPAKVREKYRGAYDKGFDVLYEYRLERMKELGVVPNTTQAFTTAPKEPSWDSLTKEQQQFEARKMEIYAAMIDDMDEHIGKVINYLKTIKQYKNTLIIFISDNGAEGAPIDKTIRGVAEWQIKSCDNSLKNLGAGNSFTWLGAGWARVSSAPLRMWKGSTAEGGIRVPAIVHYPKSITKNGISHNFVTVKDIAPTLLEIAQTEHPGNLYKGRKTHPPQGKSMWSMLTGASNSIHDPDYFMGWELSGRRAIRQGNWKLLWEPRPFDTQGWTLHDLNTDINEIKDLSQKYPDKASELKALWEAYTKENSVLMDSGSS